MGIKPKTPVEVVVPYVEEADMVLVMTVEPGFGGQAFMADMMSKVQYLREHFKDIDIEVDGGVSTENIELCAEAGANMIVSGSALVNSSNPAQAMQFMRTRVSDNIQKSQLER